MLTHQPMLVFHHASVVLQQKSIIHHPLEVLKVSSLQSIGQSFIQAIQETFVLLLISVDLMRGIVRQLSELSDILVRRHGPLFQILKHFLLQLDHFLGNVMWTESSSKIRPVDALGLLMSFHISIPPVGYRTRKLVRG
jgi:hypothetical protein